MKGKALKYIAEHRFGGRSGSCRFLLIPSLSLNM